MLDEVRYSKFLNHSKLAYLRPLRQRKECEWHVSGTFRRRKRSIWVGSGYIDQLSTRLVVLREIANRPRTRLWITRWWSQAWHAHDYNIRQSKALDLLEYSFDPPWERWGVPHPRRVPLPVKVNIRSEIMTIMIHRWEAILLPQSNMF